MCGCSLTEDVHVLEFQRQEGYGVCFTDIFEELREKIVHLKV
jgi:hypothetical protein